MAAVHIVTSAVIAILLYCYVKRQSCQERCPLTGTLTLEYLPGRTYKEFLTRKKSEATLLSEQAKFANFIEGEEARRIAATGEAIPQAAFFLPRDP